MMDQYKEQYKKETEQIHAPADLIAKTKAAVREEEARVQRERAAQTAGLQTREASAALKKHGGAAAARRWAYPLTAVAAILVLASVSMMMRGLGKTDSDGAVYESAAAADNGAKESASETADGEAVFEEAFVSEGASGGEVGAESAAGGLEMASADETAGAAEDTELQMDSGAVSTESADGTMRAGASEELLSESEDTENAMSQKKEALADCAAVVDDIIIERVREKPAFADRADTELRTYEDMVFHVAEEDDGWAAYVESEGGDGYVIRGGAETIEAFLEAGYRKLREESKNRISNSISE